MGDLGAHLAFIPFSPCHTGVQGHRKHQSREGHVQGEAQLLGIFSQLLSQRLEGFLNKGLGEG